MAESSPWFQTRSKNRRTIAPLSCSKAIRPSPPGVFCLSGCPLEPVLSDSRQLKHDTFRLQGAMMVEPAGGHRRTPRRAVAPGQHPAAGNQPPRHHPRAASRHHRPPGRAARPRNTRTALPRAGLDGLATPAATRLPALRRPPRRRADHPAPAAPRPAAVSQQSLQRQERSAVFFALNRRGGNDRPGQHQAARHTPAPPKTKKRTEQHPPRPSKSILGAQQARHHERRLQLNATKGTKLDRTIGLGVAARDRNATARACR